MPKWGLTDEQCKGRPWGLDPKLLAPEKTITDPVHGDVYVNKLESMLLDSPSMQRLRRVRQLGTTHLVYPGATHSRYSHALGTMRASQDLLDAVWFSSMGPKRRRPPRSLLDEWGGEREAKFAQATVLARLGGLLHDLCHVPLGHTIEDDLKVLTPHDGNVLRFQTLWRGLDADARTAIEANPGLLAHLRGLILSKEKPRETANGAAAPVSEFHFVHDIVGNTICADLIDYLRRDHLFTGLPMDVGSRFLSSFYVMPMGQEPQAVHYPARMVIQISSQGKRRMDIVTELLKYLRYRYELTERVLNHHAKVAVDAMIGKLLEMWSDTEYSVAAKSITEYRARAGRLSWSKNLDQIKDRLADTPSVRRLPSSRLVRGDEPSVKSSAREDIRLRVEDLLEAQFTSRSDDSLLEHLAHYDKVRPSDRRSKAMRQLAQMVLDRHLFKPVGIADADGDKAIAETIYKKSGTPEARARLERDAAAYAGIKHGWHVVLWIPKPDMRFKIADVLVDDGSGVAPLSSVERSSRTIVEDHMRLWAITVFAHPALKASDDADHKLDAVLAFLTDRLGIHLRRWDGEPVAGRLATAVRLEAQVPEAEERARWLSENAAKIAASVENDTFELLRERVRLASDDQLG